MQPTSEGSVCNALVRHLQHPSLLRRLFLSGAHPGTERRVVAYYPRRSFSPYALHDRVRHIGSMVHPSDQAFCTERGRYRRCCAHLSCMRNLGGPCPPYSEASQGASVAYSAA